MRIYVELWCFNDFLGIKRLINEDIFLRNDISLRKFSLKRKYEFYFTNIQLSHISRPNRLPCTSGFQSMIVVPMVNFLSVNRFG